MSDLTVSNSKSVAKSKLDKNTIKWLITFLVPIFFYVAVPMGIADNQKRFLAITLWAVLSWVTEIMPNAAVGMLLPTSYVMFQVAPSKVAFGPWSNSMIWMTLGAIVMGEIMINTGLSKRIAYWAILKMTKNREFNLNNLIWGLTLAGVILSFLVPSSSMGRLSMMLPLAVGICQVLDIKPKTKDASAIMLGAFFAAAVPGLGILTGNGQNLLANGVLAEMAGARISWLDWFLHNLIPALIWTTISIFAIILVLKPGKGKTFRNRDDILSQYKAMGPMKSSELKILIVVLLIIFGFITQDIHKLNANWFFTFALPLYFMPGIEVMSKKEYSGINVMIIFFIAGAMGIGAVAGHIGISQVIADKLVPYLSGSPLILIFGTWLFASLANFLLTPLAIAGTFSGLFGTIAQSAGVNIEAVLYALLYGCDIYIFPYEFALLLFTCSFGYLGFRDIIKVMVPRSIAGGFFIVLVAYPFWKLIGLL